MVSAPTPKLSGSSGSHWRARVMRKRAWRALLAAAALWIGWAVAPELVPGELGRAIRGFAAVAAWWAMFVACERFGWADGYDARQREVERWADHTVAELERRQHDKRERGSAT